MRLDEAVKLDWDSVQDRLVLFLFFSLPLHRNASTLAIVLVLLISALVFRRSKLVSIAPIDWVLPLLFFYYLLSNLLTGGSWPEIEKRLLLLAVPLVFWLNPNFSRLQLRTKVYTSYVIGILFSEIYCTVRAVIHSLKWVDGNLIFMPKMHPDTDYDFLTASIRDGNYFFGEEFSHFMHPIYFGLYIVFAQFLMMELLKSNRKSIYSWLLIFGYLSQFIFLFLLSSKAAIICSVMLAFYLALTVPHRPAVKGLLAIALSVFAFAFIFYNPRMKLFSDIFESGLSINPNARSGHELRLLSWDAALEIVKENLWFGVGEGNKETVLNETYVNRGYALPAKLNLNSHNQYLDFLLGGGVLALGIYLCVMGYLFVASLGRDRYPLLIFVLLFSAVAFFENLLSRHAGVLLFAVFTIYFGHVRSERDGQGI